MKIKFLATGQSPERYSFDGDIITAFFNGKSDSFDLSALQHGDKFVGVESDALDLPSHQIIRKVERDKNDVLWVTLCQKVGEGNWIESDWMDATEYVEGVMYVKKAGDLNG